MTYKLNYLLKMYVSYTCLFVSAFYYDLSNSFSLYGNYINCFIYGEVN